MIAAIEKASSFAFTTLQSTDTDHPELAHLFRLKAFQMYVSESTIREGDLLVVTIFAAGRDEMDCPAFGLVIERERGRVIDRIGWLVSPADENHQIGLAQALIEAAKHCGQRTTIRVETTSKPFVVDSLNSHLPHCWKPKDKWPKRTGKYFKDFDTILADNQIRLAEARHIKSSPALNFIQVEVAKLRRRLEGRKDIGAKDSPY